MKKNTNSNIILCALLLFICGISQAQVGINTDAPRGALDIKSSTAGLVYPRVALTKSNVASPVTNPNGGTLAEGTAIYNTSYTKTGTNDVHPGIYVWSGSLWMPQYIRQQYKKYTQSGPCQRTNHKPNANTKDPIAGLNNVVFKPKFTGKYKIKVYTNYGSGEITNFQGNNNDISIGTSEGNFYFTLTGTGVTGIVNNPVYTHAYSVYNDYGGFFDPATSYSNIMHNAAIVYYQNLIQDTNYTFSLSIAILENASSSNFVDNGDLNEGRGHIGHDIPCTVEFIYLGE